MYVQLKLEMQDLWNQFNRLSTEMIVTKSGRRMFPTIQVSASGMDVKTLYNLMVDFVSLESKRYRYSYHQSAWVVAGPSDPELPPRVINFDKLKITNNQMDTNGYVSGITTHKNGISSVTLRHGWVEGRWPSRESTDHWSNETASVRVVLRREDGDDDDFLTTDSKVRLLVAQRLGRGFFREGMRKKAHSSPLRLTLRHFLLAPTSTAISRSSTLTNRRHNSGTILVIVPAAGTGSEHRLHLAPPIITGSATGLSPIVFAKRGHSFDDEAAPKAPSASVDKDDFVVILR
ncbi:unnamed protein product [Soboliphyme baturini]|uniref:T-box domain-containing protein n=1 Tax=Soboliphyme baturini TaxID=241478 RepID=A0A183J528_9BILA|nr:unnamed protein product [Soboliphyme baturini]